MNGAFTQRWQRESVHPRERVRRTLTSQLRPWRLDEPLRPGGFCRRGASHCSPSTSFALGCALWCVAAARAILRQLLVTPVHPQPPLTPSRSHSNGNANSRVDAWWWWCVWEGRRDGWRRRVVGGWVGGRRRVVVVVVCVCVGGEGRGGKGRREGERREGALSVSQACTTFCLT